ncbi:fatty acid desaturase [Methylosinus trichosporium]|uniref:fatty acid desaturase n=1 Tax=Methylosinus TaxID=425 RepID=UPI000C1A0912|nr:fatty acid desaturase [Methylosinus trichosporium]
MTDSHFIPDHEGEIGDDKSGVGSVGAAHGLMLAVAGDTASNSWFEQHEGPTLLVAAAIYAGWLLLLASHEYVPWWITAPLAGYVVQWHSSLQHEAIHGMRGIPKWLRRAVVWAPIGVWHPFELYRRSHSQHHRNRHITYPGEDPESYYNNEEDWNKHGDLWRRLLTVNQTFLGRLFIGPFLQAPRLFIAEVGKMIAGDTANAGIWFRHCIGLASMLLLVTRVFEMSVLSYLVEFIYSGFVFGMMRSFTEHRWGERPGERTAVVESNWVFGLLFLWNNLHAVHHLFPTLSWWKLPRVWRRHRERIQMHNGGFVFRGYGEIARQWLTTPNFTPIHPPGLTSKNSSDAAVLEPGFATQPRITLDTHAT